MIHSKSIASLLLAAGLASGCTAQIAKVNKGYLFRVKFDAGKRFVLDTKTTIANKGSTNSGVYAVPIVLEVLNVKDGVATLRLTVLPGKDSSNPKTPTPSLSRTVQVDSRNRPSGKSGSSGVGATLPEHPIQVGATWEAAYPFNFGKGQMNLKGVYRFAGMRVIDGKQVAYVTYSLTGAATGTGTMVLLAKDGSISSNEMMITIPGINSVSTLHVLMKRRA